MLCGGGAIDFGFWILDFGFWILDFGFRISDFGFRIFSGGDFAVARGAGRGQLGRGNMGNVTLLSVHGTYGLAVLLFVAAAGWRFRAAGARAEGTPPEVPAGKVAVWFYRPMDLLGIALLAGLFYAQAVGGAVMGESDEPIKVNAEGVVVSIGLQFLLAGIALAIVVGRVGPVSWLGLRWREWPWVLLIAPGTVMCMWAVFAGLQGLGYMDLMDKLGVEKVQDTVAIFQKEKDMAVLILMGFTAAVVAPVCEEVVFRGYLYPAVKRFAGPWMSALCTALMFSAAHGSVSALVPLFVFGLALAALYEFTGSIWAPMAAHFLFNAATVASLMAVRIYDLELPT
jgi:membrane protease YdiL (CAAX protease family)